MYFMGIKKSATMKYLERLAGRLLSLGSTIESIRLNKGEYCCGLSLNTVRAHSLAFILYSFHSFPIRMLLRPCSPWTLNPHGSNCGRKPGYDKGNDNIESGASHSGNHAGILGRC
jgi:hypothetical protein